MRRPARWARFSYWPQNWLKFQQRKGDLNHVFFILNCYIPYIFRVENTNQVVINILIKLLIIAAYKHCDCILSFVSIGFHITQIIILIFIVCIICIYNYFYIKANVVRQLERAKKIIIVDLLLFFSYSNKS